MKTTLEEAKLFCRIFIQSDLPQPEFVGLVVDCIGGQRRSNSVTSESLDILIDENDSYDLQKAHIGEDRWLFFKYSLEIDPMGNVSRIDYLKSLSNFVESLWKRGIEAVAACDFEELLPRNLQRQNWMVKTETQRG
jgi:hypothetical protein